MMRLTQGINNSSVFPEVRRQAVNTLPENYFIPKNILIKLAKNHG
jgi:hypothetical protein